MSSATSEDAKNKTKSVRRIFIIIKILKLYCSSIANSFEKIKADFKFGAGKGIQILYLVQVCQITQQILVKLYYNCIELSKKIENKIIKNYNQYNDF